MDKNQFTYDSSIIKPITRIDFDILDNDVIRKISALAGTHGVEIPDLYDKQEPRRGGLIDPRMGGSGNSICATCKLNSKYCNGHSGHIDLAEPVFHPLYLQYVKTILDCICINCSNILISKENEKIKNILDIKSNKKRLHKIHEIATKAKYCLRKEQGCGTPVSKIKIEIKKSSSSINILSETEYVSVDEKGVSYKKKQKLDLTPELISNIFDNISDEDCKILGMDPSRSRPSAMIHKVLIVPPVHVRPSTKGLFSGGSTMEDGLTHQLANIIKSNSRINKQKETNNENTSKYSKDHKQLLQFQIASYYDPDIISVPKMSSKMAQFKPLIERFKGKSGRVRNNIMGKRGNFNARTVITSDPTINCNELGVPIKIAMNLTFPEIVTPQNYERMTQLVRNGSDKYPGANFVFRGNSIKNSHNVKPIYLKFRKEKLVLQYGDVVERHLVDGDTVFLNRQPTLHKQSMMGHIIKVINDESLLTFRLSVAVTTPYNADFDGDEMNIHVPQSIQTMIEVSEIANVKKQIVTPSKSFPVIGLVQDGLLGAFNLTDDRVRINWRDTMNLISYTSFDDFEKLDKNKIYTGKEIFSLIIPKNISMSKKDIDIVNSKLIKGKVEKSILGAKNKNNIIQFIWDEYGDDATKNFIDNCQKLVNNFNLWNGFTVGIKDAQVNKEAKKEIIKYIQNVMNKCEIDITNMENNPNIMEKETFERKIFSDLNVIRDDVSKIAFDSIDKDNNFGIMINSGSKGKKNNLGQMSGCAGLQAFQGGLMPKSYNNRTLCYFHENDDRASSRGVCYNSFMDGLRYSEFCYLTKAGRTGLIETVVKTSVTGYAQRKLIKTMEDIMIKYDGTVRATGGQIIQQVYGGNGNDTTIQYEYKIRIINMSNKELEDNYKFTKDELKKIDFSENENNKLFNMIKKMRDLTRRNFVKAKLNYITMNNAYMLPINIIRIISSNMNKNKKGELVKPKYVIEQIESLLRIENISLIRISKSSKDKIPYYAEQDDIISKTILKIVLYDSLSPKIVINKYKMTKNTFDNILNDIKENFNDNIAEPGEMVGIISAQSLGEAVTQMTLDSFHNAGAASLTHSLSGVPRINELMSVTKNPKKPQMFVYLNNTARVSREISNKIGSFLEKITINDIRKTIEVIYDNKPKIKGGYMAKDNVKQFYSKKLNRTDCSASIDNLPWLIRIEIDKEKMINKEISLIDIKTKFCSWWNIRHITKKRKKEKNLTLKKITSLAVLSNTDNDINPVIHIRFNVRNLEIKDFKNKEVLKFSRKTLIDFTDIIDNFKLKGIENIEKINTISKERFIDANDGDSMKMSDEYIIYTSGVNLKKIRYLNGIDIYRTYSDNITEIYNTFGIEFARNRLISEFLKAYENAGNVGLNPQHISLLVDTMCYTGSILSADRHGMKKSPNDPLVKASFEETIDTLISASVYGDSDKMQGVSSRMHTGSVIKGGTGYCELVLDTNMIQNSEYVDKEYDNDKDNVSHNTIANSIIGDDDGEDIYIPE